MKCGTILKVVVGALVLLGLGLYYLIHVDLQGGRNYLRNATRAFEDVEIRVSDKGIKYINAQTYEGALYGLGVAHARDRLWQMYFFRLMTKGRISEVCTCGPYLSR
jgi:penicillin amidase